MPAKPKSGTATLSREGPPVPVFPGAYAWEPATAVAGSDRSWELEQDGYEMMARGIRQLLALGTDSAANALLLRTNQAAAEVRALAEANPNLFEGLLSKQPHAFIPWREGDTLNDSAKKWLRHLGVGRMRAVKPSAYKKVADGPHTIATLAARAAIEIEAIRSKKARKTTVFDGEIVEADPTHWPLPTGKSQGRGQWKLPGVESVRIQYGDGFQSIIAAVGWEAAAGYLPTPPLPTGGRTTPVFKSWLLVAKAWRTAQADSEWKALLEPSRDYERGNRDKRRQIRAAARDTMNNHAEANFRDGLLASLRSHSDPVQKHAPKRRKS